ncbi:MAG TPA: DUF3618 domain-containing protein [Streptosporangiaceae bacterium]
MSTDQQRLEEDVERARARLGETVAALAVKADVKQHARDAADRVRSGVPALAKGGAARVRSGAPALARGGAVAGAAALAVSVAVVAWRRKTRPHHWWQKPVATKAIAAKAMVASIVAKKAAAPRRLSRRRFRNRRA